MTFEKFALFENCYTAAQDGQQYDEEGNSLYDASSGGGGAIYHHVKGTMTFLNGLNMTDNTADSYVSGVVLKIPQKQHKCYEYYTNSPLSTSFILSLCYVLIRMRGAV